MILEFIGVATGVWATWYLFDAARKFRGVKRMALLGLMIWVGVRALVNVNYVMLYCGFKIYDAIPAEQRQVEGAKRNV